MNSQIIRQLQAVLDHYTASGEECGCQLTVYRHGKLLCDLVSGYTDGTRTVPVRTDTLFPIFSVGKGILATLFHRCAEKGMIGYDDPVVRYWPEFGACGKEETKVWHLLTHRAGLYSFPKDYDLVDWFQWEKACACLAGMKPLDRIGGIHHYHAHTFGILAGRVLELAAARPLRELLQENVLAPLGITDFFYGIPDDRVKDLAKLVPYRLENGETDTKDGRLPFNDLRILQGLNPSSNGTANAHALARIYASLLEDGTDGVRLLRPETLENALILRRSEDDPVREHEWDRFGLGYALIGPEKPYNRLFGHGGAAGSEGFADRESGYAVGFTRNQIARCHPCYAVRNAVSGVLGIPERVW